VPITKLKESCIVMKLKINFRALKFGLLVAFVLFPLAGLFTEILDPQPFDIDGWKRMLIFCVLTVPIFYWLHIIWSKEFDE